MAMSSGIPKNNLETLRRARKLSMDAVGQAIGVDASTINKIEKGKIRMTNERLMALADALGVTPNEIMGFAGSEPAGTPVAPADKGMLPVMGAAAGSLMRGTFQITDGPVDWIDVPKALENAKGIYALYIDGTSMEPMFRHGSLCVVSEFKPPRLGDVVVIQERKIENGPLEASIGILASRNGEKTVLHKLNPPGNIEIKTQQITTLHKVLDYAELLGVS